MSTRKGPPKHQNKFAWKPKAGVKINESEVGGRFRPYSDVTGVCNRCKEQIEWKRKYGKYKPLTEPAKCQKCSKRAVRQAYHNICTACAKENNVCAKCSCRVGHIVGRDISEVEAEQKRLEEAINNARERDRRTLLRTMNKAKPQSPPKLPSNEDSKVGDLFTASSIKEYAKVSRHGVIDDDGDNDNGNNVEEEEDGDDNSDHEEEEEDGENNSNDDEDGDHNSNDEEDENPKTRMK